MRTTQRVGDIEPLVAWLTFLWNARRYEIATNGNWRLTTGWMGQP